ncbi:hypothetical protein [Halopseudomonas pelagia]|uniref:hypothetical protein n=1 Tax=Halopseudomonas pelagia TaxID=553151 RepID=UPI0030D7E59C|tara:strand:- start:514 stop:837 length:324 start_codon:yes stop_codon:yes gene_type:complete
MLLANSDKPVTIPVGSPDLKKVRLALQIMLFALLAAPLARFYNLLLNAIKNNYHLTGVDFIQRVAKVPQSLAQREVEKNATDAIVSQLTTLPIVCTIDRLDRRSAAH